MSPSQFDDLMSQALHDSADSQWTPDVAAAYAKLQHRAQWGGPGHTGPRRRSWTAAGLLSAAAAVAVVLAVNVTATSVGQHNPSGDQQAALAPHPSPAVPAAPAPVPKEADAEERPARSAKHTYTPQGVCGLGYKVIDQHSLARSDVYLLWNSATKQNCVVTLKRGDVGTDTPTTAFVQADGSARVSDSGNFSYYAGPVRQKALSCVTWGGSDGPGSAWQSRGHCSS